MVRTIALNQPKILRKKGKDKPLNASKIINQQEKKAIEILEGFVYDLEKSIDKKLKLKAKTEFPELMPQKAQTILINFNARIFEKIRTFKKIDILDINFKHNAHPDPYFRSRRNQGPKIINVNIHDLDLEKQIQDSLKNIIPKLKKTFNQKIEFRINEQPSKEVLNEKIGALNQKISESKSILRHFVKDLEKETKQDYLIKSVNNLDHNFNKSKPIQGYFSMELLKKTGFLQKNKEVVEISLYYISEDKINMDVNIEESFLIQKIKDLIYKYKQILEKELEEEIHVIIKESHK